MIERWNQDWLPSSWLIALSWFISLASHRSPPALRPLSGGGPRIRPAWRCRLLGPHPGASHRRRAGTPHLVSSGRRSL